MAAEPWGQALSGPLSSIAWLLVCPLAYLLAGSTKFLANSARARRLAFDQIGLGGFPSTHTAIVSAPAWLIALNDGINTPAFAVALGIVMIVVIDAMDLRRKLERVNRILKTQWPDFPPAQALRDRIGHTPLQIAAGLVVGGIAAALIACFS